MGKVKSKRKAAGKTVKRKGTNQQKKRKVMVTTKAPNIQSTKREQKQNVVAAMNLFYFQVLYFNSSRTEMSFIDMMANSLLEVWNPVWTTVSNGASHHKGFLIYIIVPWHNKFSPFSFFFGPGFL